MKPGYEKMSYVDQELTVEDMLADPIVQTLMRYDGISASDVRQTIEQVNQNRGRPDTTPNHLRLRWHTPDEYGARMRHDAA